MKKLRTGPAPGHPGAKANWASGRKSAVGRSVDPRSHVWFTIGDGVLNEIYYPRADLPCTKDVGLIVIDDNGFFSEERIDTDSEVRWTEPGVPAFHLTNTHKGGRYRIHKEIVSDPHGHVVFQRTRFEPLVGNLQNYRLFALAAPHLGDHGLHNTACVASFKGTPVLMAESRECGMAMACSTGWLARSVGYVAKSDGWQDLHRHGDLTWHYDHARDGNVALTGEVHLPADGTFTLLLGFGRGTDDACSRVHAAFFQDFNALWKSYVAGWKDWQAGLCSLAGENLDGQSALLASAAVLRVHEDEAFPGARVASLSIPWGESRTQEMASGYHAVWPRDAAQCCLGLLACRVKKAATATLTYLQNVQEADGNWPQNMWVDGSAYWDSIQVDSVAAPLLLYEIARQEGAIEAQQQAALWPLVRRAATFICRNGPVTQQDRWERTGGFSPYTLSFAISALVIAAQAANEHHEVALADYLLDTADGWNAQIENWTWCSDSKLARSLGLAGYYARLVPSSAFGQPEKTRGCPVFNSELKREVEAREIVSPDVWALVRYGLRPPDDPRVALTTRAVDATLRCETASGPVWHRYNHDGYGETANGEPYEKEGIGRGWPLLTGERAHHEIALGNVVRAKELLATLEALGGDHHLIPEQVWDAPDIPDRHLWRGKSTGSARPLAWAHAEHLQLIRSIGDGRIFSRPALVENRYAVGRTPARHTIWRPNLQTESLLAGTSLRIEMTGPAKAKWSSGTQSGTAESQTSPVGLHFIDLPPNASSVTELIFVLKQGEGEETGPYRLCVSS